MASILYMLGAMLILGTIIIIHEFGHFFAAKIFGVGVVEYSIGMGPMLFCFRKKDTVWSFRILPIGGFCAMYGENSLEAKDKGSDKDEKKKKTFFQKYIQITDDPQYKTDWKPEQALNAKEKWKQLLIYLAGPFVNIATGFLIAIIYIGIYGGAQAPYITDFLGDDVPAIEAGLQIGDIITKVDTRKVLTAMDYQEYTRTHTDTTHESYVMTVNRNGEELSFRVYPDKETHLIGIHINTKFENKGFFGTIRYGIHEAMYWLRMSVDSIHMLAHKTAGLNDMTGVLGTTVVMKNNMEEAAEMGTKTLIKVIMVLFMFISINLGFMNLLPIPALDGGRALIIWIEGAFNKTIPQNIEYWVNVASFSFVMLLMLYTLVNDFIKIVMDEI